MAGVPGTEVEPLVSAATRRIKARSGRIKGRRSAGSMRSRARATSCTRGSRLRIDSSTVGPRWRDDGGARHRHAQGTTVTKTTRIGCDGVSRQGHDVDHAKNRRRNHAEPAGETPGRAPGRSQAPGVLARGFSCRSVIDTHPLQGMGDVSKAIEAATTIVCASVRRHDAPTRWGRLLARSLTSLFHEPPPEPCLQLSPHTALQRPESQKVGSGHFGYLSPYRSGPPAPLRHVTGSPGLGLLRGLRRPGARAL